MYSDEMKRKVTHQVAEWNAANHYAIKCTLFAEALLETCSSLQTVFFHAAHCLVFLE